MPQYECALSWLILKWYTILEDFFLLDSVRYHDDVMTTLKSDLSNLKILMSVWYRNWQCMCYIYMSAMSWRYRGWCHSNIFTISEYPLGILLKFKSKTVLQISVFKIGDSELSHIYWRNPYRKFHFLQYELTWSSLLGQKIKASVFQLPNHWLSPSFFHTKPGRPYRVSYRPSIFRWSTHHYMSLFPSV